MTADVVKDRRPRQGTSQDILKGGREGDGSPCVKERVLTRLPCRPPSRVLLKKKKKKKNGGGGGGGEGHRHPRTPSLPPPCQLRPRIRFPGSGKQLAFGVSKFHDNRLGTRPSGRVFFSILRYYLIYLYRSTVYSFLFAFRFPWSDRSLRDQFLANFKISIFAVVP